MKRKRIRHENALIFALLFAMLAFVCVECTSAATIHVPGDYATIQCAVDNATAGDTIVVKSGTYYENVNVNKTLSLRGVDKPLVDANGSGSVITLSADGITLESFAVTNSGSLWRDAGIRVSSNNNTITDNNASKNNGKGIHLYYSSNNTITGNTTSSNDYYGIYLDSSTNNTISGNNVSNNKHDGISIWWTSGNNIITGNNVSNNNCSFETSSDNRIYLNSFKNIDKFYSENSVNIWNSTSKRTYAYKGKTYTNYLGNYWSEYKGKDANGDGIGDTPYHIVFASRRTIPPEYTQSVPKDNYPLMEPREKYVMLYGKNKS